MAIQDVDSNADTSLTFLTSKFPYAFGALGFASTMLAPQFALGVSPYVFSQTHLLE